MVLQIVADAGRVEHDVDAVLAQAVPQGRRRRAAAAAANCRRRSTPGFPCARARGLHRVALPVFDADRAPALEQHALRRAPRSRPGDCCASSRRAEIGHAPCWRGGRARRGLEKAGAFLGRAVEIGIGRDAGFDRGDHEGFRQRIGMPPVRHRQRAAGAVIFAGAARLVLGLLEIGQHVVIAPAGIAALAPAIVILDAGRAHTSRPLIELDPPSTLPRGWNTLRPFEPGLRLGLVHPVDGLVLEQLAVAERHVDPEIGVLGARLQQQHRMLAVRRSAGWRARSRPSRRRR